MVIVDILLATICFSAPVDPAVLQPDQPAEMECHNVLIGRDTPKGTYTLQHRLTDSPFYGGDVLQFKEDDEVYAVHRVWLGRPYEHRERRIKSPDVRQRHITLGCVNVEPAVYDKLVKDHSTDTLIIK